MPYVNIKITKENEPISSDQKAEIIKGVTDLLYKVINRGPSTTVVVIDEVSMDNYGIGGEPVTVIRNKIKP